MKEILLFQAIAIIAMVVGFRKGNKKVLDVFFTGTLIFFVAAVPYMIKASPITRGQSFFVAILYGIALILGTLAVVMISKKNFYCEFEKLLPIGGFEKLLVLDKVKKREYFLIQILIMLFFLLMDVVAMISYGNKEFLYVCLKQLSEMPLAFFGFFLSILFAVIANGAKRKSMMPIAMFSFGVIVYSIILGGERVIRLTWHYRILVFAMVVICYFKACYPKGRLKLTMSFGCIFNVLSFVLLLPEINVRLVNFIVKKAEAYRLEPAMDGIVLIGCTIVLIGCAIAGLYLGYRREMSKKYVTLYILDKKYKDWFDVKMDKALKSGIVYGIYCLSGTHFAVNTATGLEKLEKIAMISGKTFNPFEKMWCFVIETDTGWYYCFSGGAFIPWDSVKNIFPGDLETVNVKVQVIDKKELDYLSHESSILKLYSKNCGSRDCAPVLLEGLSL